MKKKLPSPPFFTLLSAAQAGQNPEKFFKGCLAKSGDPFCVRLPGTGDIYFTSSPDGAKEVFSAPPDTFATVLPNPIEPMLGLGSLILLSGERHKRERKLLNPGFSASRMHTYAKTIRSITEAEVAKWESGQMLDIEKVMQDITLKVIIMAVFGVEAPQRIQVFIDTISNFSSKYTTLLFMMPFLRKSFLGLSPWDKFLKTRQEFNLLLDEEINQRRKQRGASREDILSLLLQAKYEDGSPIEDGDLKDELRTLLIAGHETSATGLAWALRYLSFLPEVKGKLLEEVRTTNTPLSTEELVKLPYLEAVCKEALRIHPVVPIVLRRVVKPFRFMGYDIPPQKIVGVCSSLLHQYPSVWKQADEFIPERFVERKYSPFEYIPFGGGARRCIGAAFAQYEMKIVLGTLMRMGHFGTLNKAPDAPGMKSITTGFRKPVFIRYLGPRN